MSQIVFNSSIASIFAEGVTVSLLHSAHFTITGSGCCCLRRGSLDWSLIFRGGVLGSMLVCGGVSPSLVRWWGCRSSRLIGAFGHVEGNMAYWVGTSILCSEKLSPWVTLCRIHQWTDFHLLLFCKYLNSPGMEFHGGLAARYAFLHV